MEFFGRYFAEILVSLFVITGVCWLLDKFIFAPQRKRNALAIKERMKSGYNDAVANALARPAWLEYTAGLFGVVAMVFILRSYVTEPFRIPSSSMVPTLLEGDFILVNKYNYGLRMPLSNEIVVPTGSPKRGDVVVFHYPLDPKVDYIKRLVGLPGDEVKYENRQLTINGQAIAQQETAVSTFKSGTYSTQIPLAQMKQGQEFLSDDKQPHSIWIEPNHPAYIPQGVRPDMKKHCEYHETGFTCKVPQGQYFMMGDNRDFSEDSRYWGFVPEKNIVGRAYFVWMNFRDFSRIGTTIK
ncbi:MAG: signal peptidase I [Formosimonas sp.]